MIKLGIIGLSEGNGHPFSWSAIINGRFNPEAIEGCGYDLIPRYLAANRDTLGISGAAVTHIWTQEKSLSQKVAAFAGIPNIVDKITDLIGNVDAVILARDDAENHRKMAEPFINADIPIFIDKPLAVNADDLQYFKKEAVKGKIIMSCSSVRYAAELTGVKQNLHTFGQLEYISATGKKDWLKYGVHMLEGMCAFLDDEKITRVQHVSRTHGRDIVLLQFASGMPATLQIFYDISPTFQMSVFGRSNWALIEYMNWYTMFRDTLINFIRSVGEGKPRLEFSKTENIIRAIIGSSESLKQDGKIINI